MSHFPYDSPQFFLGKLITPQQLSWYYIPVWMGITIPVVWQLFFLAGMVSLVILFVKNTKNFFRENWQWLIIAAWLYAPWFMVLLLHSAVYDAWRHLFFIYPAFILISVFGISRVIISAEFFKSKIKTLTVRVLVVAALAVQFIFVLQFMFKNHPHENVYFNLLAGRNPEKKFDLDYWGLSYRRGLEYLAQHAKEDTIKACWHNSPGSYNLIWLPEKDRKRIKEVSFDSAEYFLTNFRFHPEQYTDSAWYTVRTNDFTILAVEKIHGERQELH